jgi:hypothetical protein
LEEPLYRQASTLLQTVTYPLDEKSQQKWWVLRVLYQAKAPFAKGHFYGILEPVFDSHRLLIQNPLVVFLCLSFSFMAATPQ